MGAEIYDAVRKGHQGVRAQLEKMGEKISDPATERSDALSDSANITIEARGAHGINAAEIHEVNSIPLVAEDREGIAGFGAALGRRSDFYTIMRDHKRPVALSMAGTLPRGAGSLSAERTS